MTSYPRTPEGIIALVAATITAQARPVSSYGDSEYTADVMALIDVLCDDIGVRTPAPPADHEGDLVAVIRRALAAPEWQPQDGDGTAPLFEYGPRPTHVLIETTEWDNGYFYEARGTVIYSDGSTEPIELDAADDALTGLASEGGQLGSQAGILVRLADGDTDFEDYIGMLTDPLIKREDQRS